MCASRRMRVYSDNFKYIGGGDLAPEYLCKLFQLLNEGYFTRIIFRVC